jgi:riboflavin kinase/FMN adenylyltransferase
VNKYSGIVQKGAKRGAALGFPTINIPLEDTSPSGIYVARVRVGEEEYEAVAFADKKRKILEAHLLDFPAQGRSASGGSIDLYGWNVSIELLEKMRDEKKFLNDTKLKATIADDIAKVRKFFKN